MTRLTRFWFEFDLADAKLRGSYWKYGVTAYSYDDAVNILKEKVLMDCSIPQIKNVVEDVDVSTSDAGHVLPSLMPPNVRGIWYPIGFFS